MDFPQYAVSKWIGHSIDVSGKQYANDRPDELFDKAAEKLHETVRKSSQREKHRPTQNASNPADSGALRSSAIRCDGLGKWSRGESNPRAGTVSKPRLHV